jgi:hypothetical protein
VPDHARQAIHIHAKPRLTRLPSLQTHRSPPSADVSLINYLILMRLICDLLTQ